MNMSLRLPRGNQGERAPPTQIAALHPFPFHEDHTGLSMQLVLRCAVVQDSIKVRCQLLAVIWLSKNRKFFG
jgi:hypothetical protein